MKAFARYFHTIRYLKPVQFYGRLWFRFSKPMIDSASAPPARARIGGWVVPAARRASLLSLVEARFLNVARDISPATIWNDGRCEKRRLYNLRFPDPFLLLEPISGMGAGIIHVGWADEGSPTSEYVAHVGLPSSAQPTKWVPMPTSAGSGSLNLHYFDDFNAEGAVERLEWHRALIERWVAENPPGLGTGWEPYPTSLRIVNWIKWALFGNELKPEWRHSLAVQVRWLGKRLEYHLFGNQLFANAKALVFAGLYFGGPEAERWLAKGAAILGRQGVVWGGAGNGEGEGGGGAIDDYLANAREGWRCCGIFWIPTSLSTTSTDSRPTRASMID